MIHMMMSERSGDRGVTRWTCMQCDRCWEVSDEGSYTVLAKGEQFVEHVAQDVFVPSVEVEVQQKPRLQ